LRGCDIDFSGLNKEGKSAVLRFLDPFDPSSNQRANVTTCLIGFDFDGFKKVLPQEAGDNVEDLFRSLAERKLKDLSPLIAEKLKGAGLSDHRIEFFIFPLPSVGALRDRFQEKIGWTK
jgi:hypothetical protein